LLRAGARIDARNRRNETALVEAAQADLHEVVHWLARHGADVNSRISSKDFVGATPFMYAAFAGQLPTMSSLLRAGAGLNARDREGKTALLLAAGQDRTEVVRWLLDHGAKMNLKSRDGQTALVQAAQSGQAGNVRLLLERGADVNPAVGWTPLMAAAANGYPEIIRLLLHRGANVNARDEKGHSVLRETQSYGGPASDAPEVLRILRRAGARG
jgi:ankyrin repeat protein